MAHKLTRQELVNRVAQLERENAILERAHRSLAKGDEPRKYLKRGRFFATVAQLDSPCGGVITIVQHVTNESPFISAHYAEEWAERIIRHYELCPPQAQYPEASQERALAYDVRELLSAHREAMVRS